MLNGCPLRKSCLNYLVSIIEGKFLSISVLPASNLAKCSCWSIEVRFHLAPAWDFALSIYRAFRIILSNLGTFSAALPLKKPVLEAIGAS